MEKKKLLLVAISVGVFLVIVIGSSILFFSPRNAVPPAIEAAIPPGSPGITAERNPADTSFTLNAPPNQPASVDPADMIRNSGDLQGLQAPPLAAAKPDETDPLVISVPRPSTAAVPDSLPPSRQTPRPPAPAAAKPAAPRTTANTGDGSRKVDTVSPAKPAAARSAPEPSKAYNAFWVQTGSFSTRIRADTVKESLAGKGITSIIENSDVNGQTYYRVRVGPYISKNEADYWLSRIKLIDGFEESQVWQSRVRN